MEESGLYVGKVIRRERINGLKCYFIESDNPEFRYAQRPHERSVEIANRGRLIHEQIKNVKGVALVWKPDVILSIPKFVNGRLENYEKKDINFKIVDDFGIEESVELGEEVPLKQTCPVIDQLLGLESAILLDTKSGSWDEYCDRWVMQDRFEQKHIFKL